MALSPIDIAPITHMLEVMVRANATDLTTVLRPPA